MQQYNEVELSVLGMGMFYKATSHNFVLLFTCLWSGSFVLLVEFLPAVSY
jgi:hypothetical protein